MSSVELMSTKSQDRNGTDEKSHIKLSNRWLELPLLFGPYVKCSFQRCWHFSFDCLLDLLWIYVCTPWTLVIFVDLLVAHSSLFEHWLVILIPNPSLSQTFFVSFFSLPCVFCFRSVFVPVSTTKFTLLGNTFFLYTNVH